MKQLLIRYARPEEGPQILDWMHANKQNYFDPRILKYPTMRVLCSYDDSGPQAYIPIHKVLMMESIALNPEISPLNAAQALRDFTKASELLADQEGIRELLFLGGHGGVGDMAAGNGRHSFELVSFDKEPSKVYRVRL